MKTISSPTNALRWGMFILLFSSVMVACRPVEQTLAPAPSAAGSMPTDTPVPQPSPTPTSLPPLVILLAPPGSDAGLAGSLRPVLEAQALQMGLRFEQRDGLALADLQPGTHTVVSLAGAENIADLAAAAPQVQFIVVGSQTLQPGKNLSVIDLSGGAPDQAAFIAGYLAGAVAQDWRIGMIAAQGAPESGAARTAYANGLAYLCGLCRPVYPPFPIPGYPIVIELPDAADRAGLETAIAELKNWQVQVVYATPQTASPELYQALAQANFQIIGSGSPPDGTQLQWIASLGGEDLIALLLQAWESAAAGSAGKILSLELALSHVNPELLSPGRQQMVEAVMADLAAGFIDTGAAANPASQP